MDETLSGLKAVAGYFDVASINPIEPIKGMKFRLVSGEKVLLSFVTLEPGVLLPLHSHPHEQLGTMLEGEMKLYLGGLEEQYGRVVKKGDAYVIPSGTPHAAVCLSENGCYVLDIFSPIREDFIAQYKKEHGLDVPGLG